MFLFIDLRRNHINRQPMINATSNHDANATVPIVQKNMPSVLMQCNAP